MSFDVRRRVTNRSFRIGMNILARGMRALMRANRVSGYFCVGADKTHYYWNGLRFEYHFSEFGVAGNIDTGGSAETETIEKLAQMLTGQIVFYDIGAHEGLYSLSIKQRFRNSTIYAFEPDATALRVNLGLNDATEIEIFECAVGEQEATVTMTIGHRSSNYITSDESAGKKFEMKTVDQLVATRALEIPTAMKVDIEGYEYQALRGASRTLSASRSIVVTEINECFHRYHQDLGPWRDFMGTLGYNLHFLDAGRLQPVPLDIALVSTLPPSADGNYWWLPKNS